MVEAFSEYCQENFRNSTKAECDEVAKDIDDDLVEAYGENDYIDKEEFFSIY
jgi:hypothetical protein